MKLKEIKIKNNETGLVIYINGVPNLKNIPKDLQDLALAGIEIQMTSYFKKKRRNVKNDTSRV